MFSWQMIRFASIDLIAGIAVALMSDGRFTARNPVLAAQGTAHCSAPYDNQDHTVRSSDGTAPLLQSPVMHS